MKKEMAIAIL